jgi:hypothetical protein
LGLVRFSATSAPLQRSLRILGVTTFGTPPRENARAPRPRPARAGGAGPGGAGAAARMLALQATAGNRAVSGLVAQRAPAVAAPAPATAGPVPAGEGEQLYPIWDQQTRKKVMVDSERYEQERSTLARYLRYLAKTIPDDAREVLKGYPFEAVKDMYTEVTDALTEAGKHYAKGELVSARFWAHEAGQFTGIEIKAHKILMDEGALSYVGKRVGLAVIGFFEGAAEAMVGLIDTGAGLVGYHPDLEGKIAERYKVIKDAYSDATGVDHTLTNDAAIGRFGGKVAENLATGKAIGQLGKIGAVINWVQAAAGARSMFETVAQLRAKGASWGDIASNPVVLAQFAGALAGAAGVGASAAPQLKKALDAAGLVLTAGQTAALTAAAISYKDDPNLSEQQNFDKRADLIAGAITSAAFLAEGAGHAVSSAAGPKGPAGAGRAVTHETAPAAPRPTATKPAGTAPPPHEIATAPPKSLPKTVPHDAAATEPAPHEAAAKPREANDIVADEESQPVSDYGKTEVFGGDMMAAWRRYNAMLKENPGLEAAIIYNRKTDTWAVVRGDDNSVPVHSAAQQLGWSTRDTVTARHSHPVHEGKTAVEGISHMPSGRDGDLGLIRMETIFAEPGTAWHAIDVVTTKGPDRTWVMYDRASDLFTVDYPSPGAPGGRGRVSFKGIPDNYYALAERIGAQIGKPVRPPEPAGGAPEPTTAPESTPASKSDAGPAPAGAVEAFHDGDLMGAWRRYAASRKADPAREVGMVYNRKLDAWAVVQGSGSHTPIADALHQLGWARADVVVARHSHPVGSEGFTVDSSLVPSGRGGDLDGIRNDAHGTEPGPTPAWEAIDVVRRDGTPDRTWVVYDRGSGTFTVDFPSESGLNGREKITFEKVSEYHRWFQDRFGFEPGETTPAAPDKEPTGDRNSPDHPGEVDPQAVTATLTDAVTELAAAAADFDAAGVLTPVGRPDQQAALGRLLRALSSVDRASRALQRFPQLPEEMRFRIGIEQEQYRRYQVAMAAYVEAARAVAGRPNAFVSAGLVENWSAALANWRHSAAAVLELHQHLTAGGQVPETPRASWDEVTQPGAQLPPEQHRFGTAEGYHDDRLFRDYLDHRLPPEGWKLHVSADATSADAVAEVLPMLVAMKVNHKVVSSLAALAEMEAGGQTGKFITIYPDSVQHAQAIVAALDAVLGGRGVTGPPVSGEFPLGSSGLVFTRYGGFTKDTVTHPNGHEVADVRGQMCPPWIRNPW